MKYCEKCDWEYEDEPGYECLCPGYRKFMEAGLTDNVPKHWKLDYWDGYINAPELCNHTNFEDYQDGSAKCLDCGLRTEAPEPE